MSRDNDLPPDTVAFIWDIDGVVVDSPHEQAWRAVATGAPWDVDQLSSDFYFCPRRVKTQIRRRTQHP